MSLENTPPPLPSSPPPYKPPDLPPSPLKPEIVQVVIDKVQQKTGMFSKQSYKMIVTDLRLIFALQAKNNIDYMHQDPNLSLSENPTNFAISLDQVQAIEVYRAGFEDSSPDSMVIKTLSEKISFQINDAYRVGQNLKKILGSIVK
ncbi:MAG: hypothetical protein CVU42_04770 [Chloroflexi bacterium HGW-Chloroflexi-4]|jgi:hypothetical protein|nr:MAG: hypothetical protein CVU42_04770 [Chloroflexi bacterium HGW-Chloroflexi-4]